MIQGIVRGSAVRRIARIRGLTTLGRHNWGLVLVVAVLLGLSGIGVGYGAPGDLDPTFGSGGIGVSFGPLDWVSALVQQPDGKLIVAGTSANNYILLARYLPDGRVDNSFGPGGKVTTAVGGHATAAAMVLQADGKLVLAGTTSDPATGSALPGTCYWHVTCPMGAWIPPLAVRGL